MPTCLRDLIEEPRIFQRHGGVRGQCLQQALVIGRKRRVAIRQQHYSEETAIGASEPSDGDIAPSKSFGQFSSEDGFSRTMQKSVCGSCSEPSQRAIQLTEGVLVF